jgi:hypothetical protein
VSDTFDQYVKVVNKSLEKSDHVTISLLTPCKEQPLNSNIAGFNNMVTSHFPISEKLNICYNDNFSARGVLNDKLFQSDMLHLSSSDGTKVLAANLKAALREVNKPKFGNMGNPDSRNNSQNHSNTYQVNRNYPKGPRTDTPQSNHYKGPKTWSSPNYNSSQVNERPMYDSNQGNEWPKYGPGQAIVRPRHDPGQVNVRPRYDPGPVKIKPTYVPGQVRPRYDPGPVNVWPRYNPGQVNEYERPVFDPGQAYDKLASSLTYAIYDALGPR